MNTETLPALGSQAETELVPAGTGPDLEQMDRADAPAIWSGYLEKFTSLKASADSVLASDPSNPMSAKLARTARLEFRKARIEIEAKRKDLGETYLRKKQAVDGEANKLKDLIEPYEEKLLAIEQHAERVEAKRKQEVYECRVGALGIYGVNPAVYNLNEISDEDFDTLIIGLQRAHIAKLEEAKKAEEARVAKEKADAEERERMRLENARLKQEVEEREAQAKAERDLAEKARVEAETKARKEREAIEAKARAEREEVERKAKAERDAAEAKAAVERAAREKLEREKRDREDAEAKRARDAEKAAKKAASAPDRQKLIELCNTIKRTPMPSVKSEESNAILKQLSERLDTIIDWLSIRAENL